MHFKRYLFNYLIACLYELYHIYLPICMYTYVWDEDIKLYLKSKIQVLNENFSLIYFHKYAFIAYTYSTSKYYSTFGKQLYNIAQTINELF